MHCLMQTLRLLVNTVIDDRLATGGTIVVIVLN